MVRASILIVDDHPLFVLEALKLVIQNAFREARGFSEAASIDTARDPREGRSLRSFCWTSRCRARCGLDGLLELRKRYPRLPIVVVSALEDPRIIHEVMTCGAAGFISKSTRGLELGNAIREVLFRLRSCCRRAISHRRPHPRPEHPTL